MAHVLVIDAGPFFFQPEISLFSMAISVVCACASESVCVRVFVCVCVHVRVCVCACVSIYACVTICIYVYTYDTRILCEICSFCMHVSASISTHAWCGWACERVHDITYHTFESRAIKKGSESKCGCMCIYVYMCMDINTLYICMDINTLNRPPPPKINKKN